MISRKVKLVVPTKGTWYAVFEDNDGKTLVRESPIQAWVYYEAAEPGNDFWTREGVYLWGGLSVYEDGPAIAEDMSNFRGYRPKGGWKDAD